MMRNRKNWLWIGAILYAQTAWGANPVLARYLQLVSGLPAMSLLSLSTFLALVFAIIIFLPRIDWGAFGNRNLLLFGVIVASRGVTNILAVRFTLAIYVQLITLLTPFLVALLSLVIFRAPLPRYTIPAMLLSAFGAILIMGDSLGEANLAQDGTRQDLLGIGIALASSLLLAFYLVAVQGSIREHIRGETLLVVQLFSLSTVACGLSLLASEDWSPWAGLGALDWFIFAMYALGIMAGANITQIGAVRHMGAAVVSSAMPWRLVSALLLAAVLLNERLTSGWQFLGVIIVLATVSWYLWRQRRSS